MTTAIKVVTTTKSTWLPALPDFEHWQTENRMGGMKTLLQDQISTVEQQMREPICMNLEGYPEAQSVALTYLETSLGFLHTIVNYIGIHIGSLKLQDLGKASHGSWCQNWYTKSLLETWTK
eukprot:14039408-Ditylum_brightwellii.AAC.1